jgi:hypothetical protein
LSAGRVLLVIADPFDAGARAFAEAHAARGALRVTPRDLSREGWRLRVGDPASCVAAVGGRRFCAGEIGGVLMRLPAVAEAHLPHIAPPDRGYVASEMTAFLLAFLTSLQCRVSNRPDPQSLCGPLWSPERWARLARDCEIDARPAPRAAILGAEPETPKKADAAVTIIGDAVFGDRALGAATVTLARAARADILQAEFQLRENGPSLLRASPFVDLADPAFAAAVLSLFDTSAQGPA